MGNLTREDGTTCTATLPGIAAATPPALLAKRRIGMGAAAGDTGGDAANILHSGGALANAP